MRMFLTNGCAFVTEWEAKRYADSVAAAVTSDSTEAVAPMIQVVEFMSYDRNPDVAFAHAWADEIKTRHSEPPA